MDARTSRYHDVYARWQRDPEGFWGEAAREIDWYEQPKKIFDKNAGIYGRWFAGGVCNTCYNALDRHVLAGRNDQAALIYDSPVTNTKQTFTYGRLLSEVQLLGAILRDFGVTKGDRVILYMPMVPEAVIGMLACARIGAIHSVVFGGFAAKELATRIDDAKPKVILSASCGIEGARVIPYKPLLDEAIELAQHKPATCLILQRPQCEAKLKQGRDHDWRKIWEHAVEYAKTSPNACRSPPPTRSTSSTPRAPPASPKAWCATMAATWSRSNGRCNISTASIPARCGGRAQTSVGWSGIPTSSMRRCSTAAPRSCTRASRSARPTPARSGASSPITAPCRCSPRPPPSAPSARKTRTPSCSSNTTCRNSARCFWPASAPIRPPSNGRRSICKSRCSITGGRRRPAGASPAIRWA